ALRVPQPRRRELQPLLLQPRRVELQDLPRRPFTFEREGGGGEQNNENERAFHGLRSYPARATLLSPYNFEGDHALCPGVNCRSTGFGELRARGRSRPRGRRRDDRWETDRVAVRL